ncbi:MAG: hypothetical protein ACKPKO_20405, partial [Candidatus Fonsibacter sp.]
MLELKIVSEEDEDRSTASACNNTTVPQCKHTTVPHSKSCSSEDCERKHCLTSEDLNDTQVATEIEDVIGSVVNEDITSDSCAQDGPADAQVCPSKSLLTDGVSVVANKICAKVFIGPLQDTCCRELQCCAPVVKDDYVLGSTDL